LDGREKLFSALSFLAGCSLPFLFAVAFITINNALPAFVEIATQYWPLYTEINGQLQINTGINPLLEVFDGLKSIGSSILWLLPAIIGGFLVLKDHTQNQQNRMKIVMMAGGVIASLMGVIAANKYWEYHWLPFIFFLILLSSIGLTYQNKNSRQIIHWSSVICLGFVLSILLRPSNEFMLQINRQPLPSPQGGRVDEIANYLEVNLQPEDTVQPLDWSNGAVQAMLIAHAKPATRFLYDFHFYHHISSPENRFIRQEFIHQLKQSKPKIIIQFTQDRPWVSGPDTSRVFAELDEFLNDNYVIDKEKNGYRLWQRK
jgi:hypothetical protein